jgi:transcriptional regulator with XRE-family HTH domain
MNDIATRIFKLLNEKGMNRGLFAQKAGISPAVLSHIASGRNAPSLDLVLAILRLFPDIDLAWLLMGKGNMYLQEQKDTVRVDELPPERAEVKVIQPDLFQAQPPLQRQETVHTAPEPAPDFQLLTRKIEELKFLVHLHAKNTADSIAQLEEELIRIKGD